MSRIGKFLHNIGGGAQSKDVKEEKEADVVDAELTEAAEKDEKSLRRIFDVARKIFLEKKLVGSFEVSRTIGALSSCVSCDIDGESVDEEHQHEDHHNGETEELTRFERVAEKAIHAAVESMVKRSRAYRKRTYAKDITLSASIGISDPFLGVLSIQFSCSATVVSLLASAAHDAHKA